MRTLFYTVAVPVLAAAAFAQTTPPATPAAPTDTAANAKSGARAADRPQEVKTEKYAGTLMDASCASTGGGADATAAPAAKSSAKDAASGSGCGVSSSTSQFALKTKDGKVVRFDDVGNARVQEAMKNRKSWSESASASKPIKVKASGLMSGDKLIVVAVD
jgi:hypothetical protein